MVFEELRGKWVFKGSWSEGGICRWREDLCEVENGGGCLIMSGLLGGESGGNYFVRSTA